MNAEIATTINHDATLAEIRPLSAADVRAQVNLIQQVMREVMTKDEHYGVIPGCKKPSLLKAGAEKLGLTFRLVPTFRITKTELPHGHREYEITCVISAANGVVVGEGVGSCSTLEKKFRWRDTSAFEVTDSPIPADAKERKAEYRKQGFGMKKVDEQWVWVRYTGSGEREENPDVADTYNTVLKMAKKRAHVDAMLTATAASDIFTQDVEDQVVGLHDNPAGESPTHHQSAAASPPAESPEQRKARAAMAVGKKCSAFAGAADETALRTLWDGSEAMRADLVRDGFNDLLDELVKSKDQRKAAFTAAPVAGPPANGQPSRPRPPIPF